ncbi:Hypothetical predicted protein [Olea europaea subsp. europaea]|uniref:Autophagy-related protein 2 n=1 Tax=Olea europaea subsp. europaea TaxID=158383 RepID=A0A8S0UVG4_OLEEU|nr:Hypothetical predicted protein [Olea europaea subsp. europaea]
MVWRNSLRILENHVSKVNEQTNVLQLVECKSSSIDTEHDDCRKVVGCVLLKSMNIIWRMYAGSDLSNSGRFVQQCANNNGRDITTSLELVLSAIRFQYDVFTDGEICASRLSISTEDFCLNDNSHNAPWKQLMLRLRVTLLHLHLHLHQKQLDFLISFFGGKSSSAELSRSATSPGPSESRKLRKKSADSGNRTVCDEAFLTYF